MGSHSGEKLEAPCVTCHMTPPLPLWWGSSDGIVLLPVVVHVPYCS